MTVSAQQFVIVGGGLAAATAAEPAAAARRGGRALRYWEPRGISPYIRPPLSKEYFWEGGRDSMFVHPSPWYAEHGVVVCTPAAVASVGRAWII